ncbi:transcription elongation factor Spt5 [Candidatus Woesearchaeota archaeon]|nr:transcription elongation factor Spt5 [Candidatus Woesearchaeota archaeon]
MADDEKENKQAETGDPAEELNLKIDTEIDTEDLLVAPTKKEMEEESKAAAAKSAEKASAEAAAEHRFPIFALRTTANREEQVMDFITSNAKKKKLEVYSLVHPHGMRGYLFIEAKDRQDAEQAAFRVPYARGLLPKEVSYEEIEHMLEPAKKVEVNIQKGDIVEIISGAAFKHSQAKVTRIDKTKEEVVVELLESAVPIPITLKLDAVKVIRRESEEGEASHQED